MGPYSADAVGRRSFSLEAEEPAGAVTINRVDAHTLRVPVAHVPYLLAVLGEVTAGQAWSEWTGHDRHGRVTVVHDGDDLVLTVPGEVYAEPWSDEDGDVVLFSVEIDYRDVAALRKSLECLAGSG